MNNTIFILCYLILALGCSENNSSKSNAKDSSKIASQHEESNQIANSNEIPDFLELSNNETTELKGYLQGVNKNDSSGPYIFKEYYSDTLSFQLFYVSKHQEKSLITFDSIKQAKTNSYRDFVCYAFVYSMKNPDKMEDYHEDNVTYPVNVRCYIRKKEFWEFLSESKVKDLTELSQYQIKCIYSFPLPQN